MVLSDFGKRSGEQIAGISGTDCERGALVFLEGLVQEVVDMARNIEQADVNSMSPFLAHSLYKAMLLLSENLKAAQILDRVECVNTLENGLTVMSRRWRLAGMLMRSFNAIN